MKMAGPDIILFVIGALLFAGAGYGLVATGGGLGGSTSALGVFEVAYSTSTVEVGSEQVADLGGQNEVTFEVDELDVATVLVTVACTDSAGAVAPFQVVVSVAGPNGTSGEGDGQCGAPIEVPVEVAQVPPDTTVAGRDEAEAHESLGAHHDTTAQGTWTVTLNGARGSTPAALPGNPSGTVTLSVEQWTPEFTPVNA